MTEVSEGVMDQEEVDAKYQAYLDHRQQLNQGELEVSGRYDHWLLTLSAGALGLSIAFLEKILPGSDVRFVCLLALSWGALVLAILSGLFSLFVSQQSYIRMRKILDADPLGNEPEPSNRWQAWTDRLNIASSLLFGLGIALLCVFALFNISNI